MPTTYDADRAEEARRAAAHRREQYYTAVIVAILSLLTLRLVFP